MNQRNMRTIMLGLWAIPLAFGCGNEGGEKDAAVSLDTKVSPDAAVCDALAAAARQQFNAALEGTAWQACQVDSDCTLLWGVEPCVSMCGMPVATSAAPAVTAASSGVCDPYHSAGCQEPLLLCLAMRPVCDHGTCSEVVLLPPDAGPPDVPPTEDTSAVAEVAMSDVAVVSDVPDAIDAQLAFDAAICDQLAAVAQAQVESYLQSGYSLACQVDSDCSFLQPRSLSCFAVCGNVVMRTADVSAVTDATASVCSEYFGAGCPEKHPPCPYSRPVCAHGTCGRGGFPSSTDAAVDEGAAQVSIDGGNG